MDKKRRVNIYKGCRRDIKINSDIYLVRNAKERSSGDDTDKASSADIIIEKTIDTPPHVAATQRAMSTIDTTMKTINDPAIIVKSISNTDKKVPIIIKNQVETVREKSIKVDSVMPNKKVFMNLNDRPANEIIINDASFEAFKVNELGSLNSQTQNERDALDNSSLFSLTEKRILRINSYTPVLVDTLLLEKLVRLDKNIARRLIFKVFKQLDEVHLPNEEILQAFHFADVTNDTNEELDFTAIIKSQEKKPKKISVKKFLTNQIYHLLHSRLTRNKERPAEVLYYLILKSAYKRFATDSDSNPDLKRVKDKIKEYADERHAKLKRRKAKQRKKQAAKNPSEEDGIIKKLKKGGKKKQKKGKSMEPRDSGKKSESTLRNNRRNALANKLLKAHKGIVVDKEKQDKSINEHLTKPGNMIAPLLSDAPDTSSSDLS